MNRAVAMAPEAEAEARAVGRGVGVSPRTLGEAVAEFFRHASPWILVVCVAVALTARIRAGAWSVWDLAPVAVLLAYWPIQEWLIHVFILHFKPIEIGGRRIDFRIPRKHREHHRNPWNLPLVFVPLHSYLYIVPSSVLLSFWLTPTTPLALTAITASFALTLHYEWVHYIVHTRYMPRSRYYQRLWRNHRLHHFKNEHYWYGVTRLQGDWLLSTAPIPAEVPASATARTLGVVPVS